MFDIGWTELVVIGVVALIVIGPKDLPEMFRTLGRFTAKARSMAREFQRAMETAAKESGVNDVAKDLKAATSTRNMGLDAVKDAASKFEKWDPLKNAAKPTPPRTPAMSAVTPVVVADAAPLGPATQALAEQRAAQTEIARDAAEKMRALREAAAPPLTDKAPDA